VVSSLFLLGRVDEALEVADTEAADTKAAGSALPATLRAQRALLLVFAGRRSEAVAEATAAAGAAMSPAEEVVVCGQLAMVSSMLYRHRETVALGDRALRRAGDAVTLRLQALAVSASTEALAGLVPEAAGRLRLAAELTGDRADAARVPAKHLFRDELRVARTVVDWLGGRWDAALDGIRTLTAELVARQQVTLAAALTTVELEVRTRRGELAVAEPLAALPRPGTRNLGSLHAWALAGYLAARGDVEGARRTLTSAVERYSEPYICLLLARLAELELAAGRPDAADKAVEALLDASVPDVTPWWRTTEQRTVGEVRHDVSALVRAVEEASAGGLVVDRALGQLALAELDRSAVDGLVEAYETFARLGAHALRRRARARLRSLGAKVPRTRSRAAGLLTEAEERVARLVQQGMRNREIAATLHYSPRSVEVYLSRVYAKLRVSSRLELARALDAASPDRPQRTRASTPR
jgi:DNA-binding CsgD family transcriptional regulator